MVVHNKTPRLTPQKHLPDDIVAKIGVAVKSPVKREQRMEICQVAVGGAIESPEFVVVVDQSHRLIKKRHGLNRAFGDSFYPAQRLQWNCGAEMVVDSDIAGSLKDVGCRTDRLSHGHIHYQVGFSVYRHNA